MSIERAIVVLALVSCADSSPKSDLNITSRVAFEWTDEALELPDEDVLTDALNEAHDIYLRERFERVLDAHDPGELLEHASLTQLALDRGVFDNADIFIFGDELFEYAFRPENGWGDKIMGEGPTVFRAHRERIGGPDSFSCADCHSKGGLDGAGSITQNAYLNGDGDSLTSAVKRNAPHLLGLGPIEALANEMTAILQSQKKQAIRSATTAMQMVEVELEAKGVGFGSLRVSESGEVFEDAITGIDTDLVVRPFGWKGRYANLREIVEFSFRAHLGIRSAFLQQRIKEGELDDELFGTGPWYDIDDDGVSVEIEDGMITSVAAYLAQLAIPQLRPPTHPRLQSMYEQGRIVFSQAECDDCHKAQLLLSNSVLSLRPEHPDYSDSATLKIDVAIDGESPKIHRSNLNEPYVVELYSDLKRHDMGPELASVGLDDRVEAQYFLTRPLWGLAGTGPFLHDGRALTIDEAIRYHGGEAVSSREAYLGLNADEQASLRIFLLSLSRQPTLEVR